jgi:hypothetical protein
MLHVPSTPALVIKTQPAPPVERLLLGRPIEEAVALLPRIFNLCRAAQEGAARLAFGLELKQGWAQQLSQDIAREHAAKLGVMLPIRLGLPPLSLPRDIADLPKALFVDSNFAETPADFEAFLKGGQGSAPVLRGVDQGFGRDACCPALPPAGTQFAALSEPMENTVAVRHLDHPVMQHIAQTRGRGPLWRLVARALDLCMAVAHRLPQPELNQGVAYVPAARGLYAVRATHQDGRVSSFYRVTPTDHILAAGGVAEHSLANLSVSKQSLAGLLIDILDPCIPVELIGVPSHA